MKEIAKFGAGIAAWESIVHLSFAACGALPLRLCGITIDHRINIFQIFSAAAVSILLSWYGWFHRSRQRIS